MGQWAQGLQGRTEQGPSPQTRALEREVEDYSSPQPTSETLTDIHNLYYG